jgi:signal transduction histidine kinase
MRVTKDGRNIHVSVSISPVFDASQRIVGASAIARDITAQKKVEDHLRQAQRMEAIGRLAGGIAHDFNNILGIIISSTELLRDRLARDSETALYVDNIRKTADRGAVLTRQLLVFGRKPVAQLEIVDLNQRVMEVSKLLKPLMGDDVETILQTRATPALVEVDPGQLDQVIVNLAVNSRDAMPHGGRFTLETSNIDQDGAFPDQHHRPMPPGKYVVLAVTDSGVGMDEATRSRVFEPFFTTKEIGKGTGLGLATAYGIVKQSGGHIWVYSEIGRGTTFKIYLPSAEHKLGIFRAPEAAKEIPRATGKTILLVEDDETFRQLTRHTLVQHGYRVLTAPDGKSALETVKVSSESIDLVLTDVVMRGMNGPDLVASLGQSHPHVKVVYMSGYTGESVLLSEATGLKAVLLEKPFTRMQLLSTIHEALG